jgi:8-oxo-dGTP diphosphatase
MPFRRDLGWVATGAAIADGYLYCSWHAGEGTGFGRMVGVTETGPQAPHRAVAMTIVTSRLGVLVGRRRDGNPPWTFPGGKTEPGESPEDAAVRETLEETGLRVRATWIIGQRVHPRTGVLITYVAAAPVEGVNATAAGQELDVVRWVSLTEALELMGNMAEDVRQYLRRPVGKQGLDGGSPASW